MIPSVKLMLVLATVLGVLLIGIDSTRAKGKKSKNPNPTTQAQEDPEVDRLRKAAQKALDAIDVKCTAEFSSGLAGRGQHVFNNALKKFHSKVLKELLPKVGGDEHLQNLTKVLEIPLSKTVKDAIGTWVATFSKGEFYVDFNGHVFGEYVRELRKALVEYLMATTSESKDERTVESIRQRVQFVASKMVEHEVYVDPMARDRWEKENEKTTRQKQDKTKKMYNQVKRELSNMFQNILQTFQQVSVKISELRIRKQPEIGQ